MNKCFLFRLWSLVLLLTGTAAFANAAQIEMPTFNIDRNGTATVQLSINDNSASVFDYQGFQFNLFLPEGISVQSYSLDQTLTDAGFSITRLNPSDGTYRFIAYAPMNNVTTEQFMTLVLAADNTVTTGSQTIKIQNVIFSDPKGQDVDFSNSEAIVNIKVPVVSITLDKTELTMLAGTEFQLTATILPSDATLTDITWNSSDTSVATVGTDGTITAIKSGTTNVTATCDGITATCVVTVKDINSDDDTNIEVTPGEGTDEGDDDETPGENTEEGGSLIGNDLTLRVGQTASINLKVTPAPEYDPNFQWALGRGGNTYVSMTVNPDNTLTASFTGLEIGETTYTVSLPKNGEQLVTGKIKVIATVPVTEIQVSPEALTLELNSQPAQLTATLTPANASVQTVTWTSSKPEVATVSADGKVSPVSVGECDIIASVADGNGITGICKVTVIPVQPRSITIDGNDIHALKTTGTLQLTAAVMPEDTPYTDVTWESSSDFLATVSDNGLVTAINAGTVTITAYVTGYPEVKDEYQIVITGRLLGDANDNGTVNVADLVTIADFINQRETWQFSFVNADVDENGEITTADIEGTLNIIKGQTIAPARKPNRMRTKAEDILIVDDFGTGRDKLQTIGMTLDNNSHNYTSMLAKIHVPEGMEIENVSLGEAAMNHTLNYHLSEDGTLHVVIYSLDSTPFGSKYAALLQITARAEDVESDLTLDRIIFSTPEVEDYYLSYAGGLNHGTVTGIDTVNDGSVQISGADGNVVVMNAEGLDIKVYAVSGQIIASRKADSNIETISLGEGIYVVKAGDKAIKIVL